MKARYLMFFSYVGTPFRSSEKLWIKQGRNYSDPESVQGQLELGLRRLKSLNYPNLTLSSRTDGGVHALNATAHVDLERYGQNIYETNNITYSLNKFFYINNTSIFVKKCLRVRDNFSARYNAISRTYLYRLAVLRRDVDLTPNTTIASYIPIEEWKKCHFTRIRNFDIEKFREGAKYLVGYHDFTTFKKADRLKYYKHSRRELKSIDVRPGQPVVTGYTSRQNSRYFDYWDIEIRGRAFVHNQIRRMIGALIAVATGKLTPEDIKVMLQVPSKHSWSPCIACAPPDGLYLCNVEYNPEDLEYTPGQQQGVLEEKDSYSDSE